MGESLCAETLSITTGKPQMLYLDEKDFSLVSKNSVVLLDDVISTGSTLEGMRLLMEQAQAKIVGESAILTEGDKNQWKNIYPLDTYLFLAKIFVEPYYYLSSNYNVV
ncbi:MAG: hypothetical protein CM1200mP6_01850 [Anaerolineaceae bacterium]|nr:MAG: hypothetical protein CM1200mP6_01850 [Anaerolineaceae bacterium]